MFVKHSWDKAVVLLAGCALFLFASLRSDEHLAVMMPAEFVDNTLPPAVRSVPEKEIAQGYWNCALIAIQRKYSTGSSSALPADPPNEFRITTADLGTEVNSDAVRRRYWHKLRHVWNEKETWVTSYEWSFTWMTNPVSATGSWFERVLSRFAPKTSQDRRHQLGTADT